MKLFAFALAIASLTACSTQPVGLQQTSMSLSGFGASLAVVLRSESPAHESPESEAAMGKHARQLLAGTARHQGQFATLEPTGWAVDVPTSTTIPATRTDARPPGVDLWRTQVQKATLDGVLINSMGTGTPTATVTGLTPATAYLVRAAWFQGLVQVSDWSAWKPATTAP